MGRVYHRDRLGRFAPKGYSGQTGGRGARLKGPGKQRAGGGKRQNLVGANDQAMKGTVKKPRGSKPSPIKVTPSASQQQIATQMKKNARKKNVQATRILQKMAAKDGHGGSVKDLTQGRALGSNRWSRTNKGNDMAASRSRDLMLDHAPSKGLQNAALNAASRGVVSRRRVDRVFRAAGLDYMGVNQGYDRAVRQAKAAQSKRRRGGR